MKNVRIYATNLLLTVRENRAKHKIDYDEAVEGYKTKVIEELQNALTTALSNTAVNYTGIKQLLQPPQNYLNEYDRIIKMLEMSSDEIIELSEQEFNQIVLDEWLWTAQFTNSSLLYNSKYKS